MHLRLTRNKGQISSALLSILGVTFGLGLVSGPMASASVTYGIPDTWTRTNDVNTTYAAWDVLEGTGAILGFFGTRVLNDSTPDIGATLGIGHSGVSYLLAQNGGGFGHRSGSSNFYSAMDNMNDTISGQTRGSTGAGFSTIVLQFKALANNAMPNLLASIADPNFTLVKQLYTLGEQGEGMYWFEWTAAGGNLDYAIQMTSDYQHVTLDSFSLDNYWTSGASPIVSGVNAAPEPTRAVLLLLAMGTVVLRRRRQMPLQPLGSIQAQPAAI